VGLVRYLLLNFLIFLLNVDLKLAWIPNLLYFRRIEFHYPLLTLQSPYFNMLNSSTFRKLKYAKPYPQQKQF